MEREELGHWLRLLLTPGVGSETIRTLLATFGLPGTVLAQTATALRQVLSSAKVAALQTEPPAWAAQLERTWAWWQDTGAGDAQRHIVVLGDPEYPASLLTIEDPPLMLYLLGAGKFTPASDAPDAHVAHGAVAHHLSASLVQSIAIVGSRNPTPQGALNARQFAKAMGAAGLTVVSGLALGVDTAAHEGALDSVTSGDTWLATVAVVGTGLDRVYPKENRELAHRIAEHGLLMSEYLLGTPPLASNFPRRNRLIAGLCQGTLVVEAALKSGSLITAQLTVDQGKEVFAIPGSIHASQARGCHALIKQGAKLVESAQDVLEEMKFSQRVVAEGSNLIAAQASPQGLSGLFDTENMLLSALGFDPVGLDALQARCGLDTPELQAQLMTLELDGRVARLPGGLYQQITPA